MKLTKGKKKDKERGKKTEGGRELEGGNNRLRSNIRLQARSLPEPPKPSTVPKPQAPPMIQPVRIQIEPRKASNVSLEVGRREERKKAPAKETIPRPYARKQPKSRKPSVTVSIFDSEKTTEPPSPTVPQRPKTQKQKMFPVPIKKPGEAAENEMQRLREKVDFLDKSLGVMVREVNTIKTRISEKKGEPANIPEADIKSMRQFMARSGSIDNQIAGLKVDLGNALRSVDSFVQRFGSLQKDMTDMKIKMATSREGKADKDVSGLKERMNDMETLLERMSEKSRESKTGKAAPPDMGEMKAIIEKISRLEGDVKSVREGMAAMTSRISGMSGQKPQDFTPSKNMNERLDSFDSRIAGMTDKLMKLSEDMQKLTSYFMEGIKHLEARMRVMESEKEAEKHISTPSPEPDFVPTTYRSHLKREREPPVEDDTDMDDYDMPMRRPVPTGPRVAMPLPPPATPSVQPRTPSPAGSAGYPQRPRPSAPSGLPAPPAPIPERKMAEPPSVWASERGNMFTRLRESTVIRRPIPQEDPDMDIILEHIRESMEKRESRDKIQRDLLNAGFEQELIDRAFMKARVG